MLDNKNDNIGSRRAAQGLHRFGSAPGCAAMVQSWENNDRDMSGASWLASQPFVRALRGVE